jgi:hypothetical protein
MWCVRGGHRGAPSRGRLPVLIDGNGTVRQLPACRSLRGLPRRQVELASSIAAAQADLDGFIADLEAMGSQVRVMS